MTHNTLNARDFLFDAFIAIIMVVLVVLFIKSLQPTVEPTVSESESFTVVNESNAPIYTIPNQCDLATVDCKELDSSDVKK